MNRREHITCQYSQLAGPAICLLLMPPFVSADPASSTHDDLVTLLAADRPEHSASYSLNPAIDLPDMGYIPDYAHLVAAGDLPDRFQSIPVGVTYVSLSGRESQLDDSSELAMASIRRVRLREKVVKWVNDRSRTAGVVTYLLVAKPDNGWHLDIDPGDEVILEWNVEF